LTFAAGVLPIRAMTRDERKTLLNGLLFESTKSALEFASEYRRYLDPQEVDEITHDYTRTVGPDFCLHLSHRNKNRKTDYFSEAQLRIFRDCAQSKSESLVPGRTRGRPAACRHQGGPTSGSPPSDLS